MHAFESFDADGSGAIDPQEFRAGLKALDVGLTQTQISGENTTMHLEFFSIFS
jgi:Ca2+-binding EF-hand superfamily protein